MSKDASDPRGEPDQTQGVDAPAREPDPAQGAEPGISRDIVALLATRANRFGRWPAIRYQAELGGEVEELSWAAWLEQAQALANSLRALGVEDGARAAIFAPNSPQWLIADVAIFMAGGVSVPLSRYAPNAARARMLAETQPRVVFVGSPDDLIRLRRNRAGLESAAHVIVFQPGAADEGREAHPTSDTQAPLSFADALIRGRAIRERGDGLPGQDSGRSPDAPATIVYSAGRTGPARGSVLTHRALVSKLYALRDVVVLPRSAAQLLALPLDTIFGRLMAWAAIDQGATTWITDRRIPLSEVLFLVRPHFIAGGPGLFESLRGRILSLRGGAAGSPGRTTLALAAPFLEPERRWRGRKWLGRVDARLARRLFRTRVRHLLGGRIRHLVCGGGVLDPRVIRLFEFADLPILEGYGSNESVGTATANRPGAERAGSVGTPLSDVELRLSPAGEVLLRGPGMFSGYLLPSAAPASAPTPDEPVPPLNIDPHRDDEGWFHTRDLGMIEEGYLFLTGRKEDIIHLSTGRAVATARIERALVADGRLRHAVACGEQRPHVSVLLWEASHAGANGQTERMDDAQIQRLVDRVNMGLERHEQIKAFARIERPLSVESGELSTHGEPVRAVIARRFKAEIDALYHRAGKGRLREP
jgi:long-chain acyl-CoA synthetase